MYHLSNLCDVPPALLHPDDVGVRGEGPDGGGGEVNAGVGRDVVEDDGDGGGVGHRSEVGDQGGGVHLEL